MAAEPAIKYRLIKKEKHTGARLGEIITPHGTFPTPMFMPVGTKATVKGLSPEEAEAEIEQMVKEKRMLEENFDGEIDFQEPGE